MSLLWLVASAWAGPGSLSALVFDGAGGPPLPDVIVNVRGEGTPEQTVTDDLGSALMSLRPGTYTVTLTRGSESHSLPVEILDDQVTELLISWRGASPPLIDSEEPDASVVEAPVDEDAGVGVLSGVVRDPDGRPLEGARIFVRGQSNDVVTDARGRFQVEVIAGSWEASVLKQGFATQTLPIEVPRDGEATLDVELVEAGLALSDFFVEIPVVEGGTAALLAERQSTSDLVDAVSAEEMSRRGDSSAASALKRVTGLTLVGGRFVYVRGLGERYSSTLLNGSTVPSPEPERRVVPLDLFPTAMLESVVIQKTFSPSMPGEFGGGVVRLRTRGIPDEPLLSISLGGTYVAGTTFQHGLMGDRGPHDWLGYDGGYRALPDKVVKVTNKEPLVVRSMLPGARGVTAEELEAVGEALPNRWTLQRTQALPDMSLSVVGGRGWKVGSDSEVGFLLGSTYRNEWELRNYEMTWLRQNSGAFEVQNQYRFQDLTNTVGLGSMFVAQARLTDDHDIRATTLLTRDADHLGRRYEGVSADIGPLRAERSRWVERMLLVQQFTGDHTFGILHDTKLSYRYAISRAWRFEPDRRDIIQEPLDDGGYILRTQGGGNGIFLSELSDRNNDWGVDLTVPLGPLDQDARWGVDLTVGTHSVERTRQVGTRRFNYDVRTGGEEGSSDFLKDDLDEIFTPENISPTGLQIAEATVPTDNYTARQTIRANYLQADVLFPSQTSVIGGVRMERSVQRVTTFELFNPDPTPIQARLDTSDALPGATVTQVLTRRDAPITMQIRLGYGKTLNRPDFRELSPAVFNDVAGGREIKGNENLERATIDNWDARWELYPSSSESLSLGVFRKSFDKPIETVIATSATSRITFTNARSAENVGAEFEFRKSLGFGSGTWVDDVYLAGNAAFIRSRIDLGNVGGQQTNTERPLQGQSPYVINGQLSYEPLEGNLSATALYNVFGPRITEVGESGLPDTVELPQHRVDMVGRYALGKGWSLKASGKNLLDARGRLRVGQRVVQEVRYGWEIGAGITWGMQ